MTSQKNKNIRKAHALLGIYWVIRILRGGSVPGTTMRVLQLERNARKTEQGKRMREEQTRQAAPAPSVKKAAVGFLTGSLMRNALRRILKAQRVISVSDRGKKRERN